MKGHHDLGKEEAHGKQPDQHPRRRAGDPDLLDRCGYYHR